VFAKQLVQLSMVNESQTIDDQSPATARGIPNQMQKMVVKSNKLLADYLLTTCGFHSVFQKPRTQGEVGSCDKVGSCNPAHPWVAVIVAMAECSDLSPVSQPTAYAYIQIYRAPS
jgi:hypothetical protein